MEQVNKPNYNFFRRLVAMYGKWQATEFYKKRVGEEPPKLEKEKSKVTIDLNNL